MCFNTCCVRWFPFILYGMKINQLVYSIITNVKSACAFVRVTLMLHGGGGLRGTLVMSGAFRDRLMTKWSNPEALSCKRGQVVPQRRGTGSPCVIHCGALHLMSTQRRQDTGLWSAASEGTGCTNFIVRHFLHILSAWNFK